MSPAAFSSPVAAASAAAAAASKAKTSHGHSISLDSHSRSVPRNNGGDSRDIGNGNGGGGSGSNNNAGSDAGHGGSGPGRPLMHIEDIKLTKPDIDPSMPLRHVIDEGNRLIREATSYRDISKQLDLAFQSYLRAFIISAQVIPAHRDRASAMLDRKDLKASYENLKRQINDNYASFELIKNQIYQDNLRTGIQPKYAQIRPSKDAVRPSQSPSSQNRRGHRRESSTPNAPLYPSPLSKTQSPAPDTGNTAKATATNSSADNQPNADELRDRFARLRNNTWSHNQAITAATRKPLGPREMPSPAAAARPKISMDTNIPHLPKMPDAIYSPARGTVTSEAAQLPSSTPRGLFSRTGSFSSTNGQYFPNNAAGATAQVHANAQTQTQALQSASPMTSLDDADASSAAQPIQVAPAPTITMSMAPSVVAATTTAPVKKPAPLNLPPGDSLTAAQLSEIMKTRIRILYIDVRTREDFDAGHIMSQSTICIEPDVLLRGNLSAADIGESLVVSPSAEEKHFENRDEFDLVVYYDQDTLSLPNGHGSNNSSSDSSARALQCLHRALTEFNYGKELRNAPRILVGGIDAWTDHAGPFSLQESSTSRAEKPKPKSNFLSDGIMDNNGPLLSRRRRSSRYIVNPLKKEDIQKWEKTMQAEEETATSPVIVRTQEEFLRRYPEVLPDKEESMTSLTAPPSSPPPQQYHQHRSQPQAMPPRQIPYKSQDSMFASPPQRPPPAVPRPNLTGLGQGDTSEGLEQKSSSSGSSGRTASSRQVSGRKSGADTMEATGEFYTGLNNPHNWCYANSVLQVLRASPGFGREIVMFNKNPAAWQVPKKKAEKAAPPQLMIKMLSNLFLWMQSGNFRAITAQTLLEYSKYLCEKGQFDQIFGSSTQQDVTEYVAFLMDQIHDETDSMRHLGSDYISETIPESISSLMGALKFWTTYSERSNSIADKYFRGITVEYIQCDHCKRIERSASVFFPLYLTRSSRQTRARDETLLDTMASTFARETIRDRTCEKCRRSGCQRWSALARLPPLLAVVLPRGQHMGGSATSKICNRISWDWNALDVSRFCLPSSERGLPETGARRAAALPDAGFAVPAVYECYAVIVHSGSSMMHSGHYYAYVRNLNDRSPYAWYKCNDSYVSSVTIGSGGHGDIQNEVFKADSNTVPYMAFFRRKASMM